MPPPYFSPGSPLWDLSLPVTPPSPRSITKTSGFFLKIYIFLLLKDPKRPFSANPSSKEFPAFFPQLVFTSWPLLEVSNSGGFRRGNGPLTFYHLVCWAESSLTCPPRCAEILYCGAPRAAPPFLYVPFPGLFTFFFFSEIPKIFRL